MASDCGYQIIVYFDLYKVEFVHKYYFCMDLIVNCFLSQIQCVPSLWYIDLFLILVPWFVCSPNSVSDSF